jgi:hypothetical protein
MILSKCLQQDMGYYNVPKIQEFSLRKSWSQKKNDKIFLQYLPDLPNGTIPNRTFTFNVFVTSFINIDLGL